MATIVSWPFEEMIISLVIRELLRSRVEPQRVRLRHEQMRRHDQ